MPVQKPKKSLNRMEDDLVYDMLSKLSDKMDTVSSNVGVLDKKLDLQTLRAEQRFEVIARLDEEQNKLLAHHAQRSEQLKTDNELREAGLRKEIFPRIEKLEVPRRWLETTKDGLLWIAAICGALVTMREVAKLFLK